MLYKSFPILFIILSIMAACTPTPTVEYDPQSAVPLSLVEDLQYSDTSSLAIAECEARFSSVADPVKVREGDVLPADFVLYIDLDPLYVSWESLALDALCAKANWGVFRTTGIVEIPTDAHIWSIDEDA